MSNLPQTAFQNALMELDDHLSPEAIDRIGTVIPTTELEPVPEGIPDWLQKEMPGLHSLETVKEFFLNGQEGPKADALAMGVVNRQRRVFVELFWVGFFDRDGKYLEK